MAQIVKSQMISGEIEHSERGPSTASRWRKCAASVRASRGLPDDAGIEAAYGTVFHDYAADCLELGMEPWGFIGDRMFVRNHGYIEFDGEMARNMIPGLDIVWAMADSPGAKLLVEQKVDLQHWVGPGEFGTTDAAIIDVQNWRLVVFDWKYGSGVMVHPERNDQAMLYALGTWTSFAADMFEQHLIEQAAADGTDWNPNVPWEDDIEVVIMIEQPRGSGGGGTWTTTMGELLAEGRRIKRDAEATEDPNAPFVPGPEQCKFCKAAKHNTCAARADHLLELAQQDFEELETDFAAGSDWTPPRALSPEARSQILLNKAMLTEWLEQLHAEAMEDAKKGRPVPGMKRVSGRRPPRKWKDQKKAELMLVHDYGEEAFNKKLRTPADINDVVGRAAYERRFKSLVEEGEASTILVPETDRRDPLPDYLSDFDVASETSNDSLI